MYKFVALIEGAAVFENDGSFYIDRAADESILSAGLWTESEIGFEKITNAGLISAAQAVSAANARLTGASIFSMEGKRLTVELTDGAYAGSRKSINDAEPEEISDTLIKRIFEGRDLYV